MAFEGIKTLISERQTRASVFAIDVWHPLQQMDYSWHYRSDPWHLIIAERQQQSAKMSKAAREALFELIDMERPLHWVERVRWKGQNLYTLVPDGIETVAWSQVEDVTAW